MIKLTFIALVLASCSSSPKRVVVENSNGVYREANGVPTDKTNESVCDRK